MKWLSTQPFRSVQIVLYCSIHETLPKELLLNKNPFLMQLDSQYAQFFSWIQQFKSKTCIYHFAKLLHSLFSFLHLAHLSEHWEIMTLVNFFIQHSTKYCFAQEYLMSSTGPHKKNEAAYLPPCRCLEETRQRIRKKRYKLSLSKKKRI